MLVIALNPGAVTTLTDSVTKEVITLCLARGGDAPRVGIQAAKKWDILRSDATVKKPQVRNTPESNSPLPSVNGYMVINRRHGEGIVIETASGETVTIKLDKFKGDRNYNNGLRLIVQATKNVAVMRQELVPDYIDEKEIKASAVGFREPAFDQTQVDREFLAGKIAGHAIQADESDIADLGLRVIDPLEVAECYEKGQR